MWTTKNRGRYDRSHLRYPSDLTDDEWALVGAFIRPAKRGGNRRHVDVREVMNGIMSDIIVPDHLTTSPSVPITPYRDGFGNWCSRLVAPLRPHAACGRWDGARQRSARCD